MEFTLALIALGLIPFSLFIAVAGEAIGWRQRPRAAAITVRSREHLPR